MSDKRCSNCKEVQPVSNFSKRGISKKTGNPLYNSWCKSCNNKKHPCPDCDRLITVNAKLCHSCAATRRRVNGGIKESAKKKINPKFLVRGRISIGATSCITSNGA